MRHNRKLILTLFTKRHVNSHSHSLHTPSLKQHFNVQPSICPLQCTFIYKMFVCCEGNVLKTYMSIHLSTCKSCVSAQRDDDAVYILMLLLVDDNDDDDMLWVV